MNELIVPFCSIFIAMIVIWRSSDGFQAASNYLGRNLTEGVRGATINAIGSSMPELFTTLFGLIMLGELDNFAFGVGTTSGSAIFNSMIIPAVVIMAVTLLGITNKVEVSKKVILRDGLGLIFCEFLLMYVIYKNKIDWLDGLFLMSSYLVYVVYMFTSMKTAEEINLIPNKTQEKGETPILKSIVYFDFVNIFFRKKANALNAWSLLLFSMGIIGSACVLLINACETIAQGMGVAPYFIAVILASAATSLPDTILSYRDAMKGDYDDAIANALGSNIFDICFALGLPIFAYTLVKGPIIMPESTLIDVIQLQISLIILTIVSFYIFYFNRGLKVIHSIYLLGLYIVFVVFIFLNAYYWN